MPSALRKTLSAWRWQSGWIDYLANIQNTFTIVSSQNCHLKAICNKHASGVFRTVRIPPNKLSTSKLGESVIGIKEFAELRSAMCKENMARSGMCICHGSSINRVRNGAAYGPQTPAQINQSMTVSGRVTVDPDIMTSSTKQTADKIKTAWDLRSVKVNVCFT
ncbi:predicted protein [Histoplasma capsulatum G186AR]|uniref:Uncharacterized protein n=1 Tax=Ajellomyces capsulatus (strain G186AR / H82 / ATCC MYA-2454 / RMSCC 2432) TaxID=447093 RepID=C0NF91_AJECG|nr:uncharacterized protein HCBG_01557 [Histoplasma capsulatum G186AR]EEH09912.1 predicted protein [Histoplasma capsulatum G186AR]